jgi:transcriptional regulator with XRE-family HTH domain
MTRKVSKANKAARSAAAKRVLEAAESRGWSDTELSARTGASLAAIASWRNGGCPLPGVTTLDAAAQVLRVGGTLPSLGRNAQERATCAAPKGTPARGVQDAVVTNGLAGEVQTVLELLLEAVPDAMLYAEVAKRASRAGAA